MASDMGSPRPKMEIRVADAGIQNPPSPSRYLRSSPLSTTSSSPTHRLVELQVQNTGLSKRLDRLALEHEVSEKLIRDKDVEILEIQRAQDNLQSLLREKEKEIEGLKTNLTKLENEHRGQHTALQVQVSDLECQLSAHRTRINELEEQVQRADRAVAHEKELATQLRRQIVELKHVNDSSIKEREDRRRREHELQQEHKERLDQQRDAHMQQQEKLRHSHSQAVEVLNLKIRTLEERLEDERTESARQINDIEERLREYEEALDELERDHDDKMHTATLEARRACEAEHSMTLADYAKCRENESRLREIVEQAERAKRDEVTKIMADWEGVYKELEELYFAARSEAERKSELLQRSQRDLDLANASIAQMSEEQQKYTRNIEWMKQRLDATRSGTGSAILGAIGSGTTREDANGSWGLKGSASSLRAHTPCSKFKPDQHTVDTACNPVSGHSRRTTFEFEYEGVGAGAVDARTGRFNRALNGSLDSTKATLSLSAQKSIH